MEMKEHFCALEIYRNKVGLHIILTCMPDILKRTRKVYFCVNINLYVIKFVNLMHYFQNIFVFMFILNESFIFIMPTIFRVS